MRIIGASIAVLLCSMLGACTSSDNPFEVSDLGLIQLLHDLPEVDRIELRLGTRALNPVGFLGLSGLSQPGAASNDLAMDITLPGNVVENLLTVPVTTAVDLQQTLVLQGTLAQPSILTFEQTARNWQQEQDQAGGNLTILEISFAHANALLGEVDIYIGEADFDPAAQTAFASLGYGDLSAKQDIESGDYEFVVTAAGDPAAVLFRSGVIATAPANSLLLALLDTGGAGTASLRIKAMGKGVLLDIIDSEAGAELRALHAASTTGRVDIFLEEDMATLAFPDLGYTEITPYIPTTTGTAIPVTVTPAGDTGVLLVDGTIQLDNTVQHTLYLLGASGDESVVRTLDDNRRLGAFAKFRLINAAVDFGTLDLYLTEPGAALADAAVRLNGLAFNSSSGYIVVNPGSYELRLTETGTENEALEPFPVVLDARGIYGATSVDAGDSTGLALILMDDSAATAAGLHTR